MGLFCTIPQSHCVAVERLGKFSRIQTAGLRFCLPLIEKRKNFTGSEWTYNGEHCAHKRKKDVTFFELSDQRLNTKPRLYHTKDNVQINVDAIIFWRIVNPQQAIYAVDDVILSIIDITLNGLRANIGNMTLDQVLSERATLTETVTGELASNTAKWGISLQKVEILELEVDDKTQSAMLKQMDAEREKRAIVSLAEGESEAKIIKAEADKKALIIHAEGVSKSQELMAQADAIYLDALCKDGKIKGEDAAKILLAQKYLDGFSIITKNPADKVFLPNSASNLFIDAK